MEIRNVHDDDEEGYDQGAWEHIRPAPKKTTGRKDGRGVHDFIDEAAFGRLVKRYGRPDGTIDARPRDPITVLSDPETRSIMVPIGPNRAVRIGDLDAEWLAAYLELRRNGEGWTGLEPKEVAFWESVLPLLGPDQNINELVEEAGVA